AEKELGISGADLSPVFALIALFSLLGKLVFGVLSDRIDLRVAILVNAGLLAGGWAILQTRPDMSMIYVAGVLFGSGVGAAGPLHAVLIGRCFGRAAFGQIMGLGGLIALPFVAGAAPLAGYLAVETGNYSSAFQMEVIALGFAALCSLFLRIPAVEEVEAAPTGATVEPA
ncbi:MAG: MFS transporter, partial [Myxococcota bacterium]|nr:MFS transporter [Myxococcota bacterium]